MKECLICKETPLIPVELICFHCFRPNTITCSSYTRVCRKCAHDYLELDKSVLERNTRKRCFFCSEKVSTRDLSPSVSYRKDYLLMVEDVKDDYTCPYCHEYTGNQLSIDHHLDNQCPLVFIQCPCGSAIRRQDFFNHLFFCSHHERCLSCHQFIAHTDLKKHMNEKHQQESCRWCQAFICSAHVSDHETLECPERIIMCSLCHSSIRFRNMNQHLEEHGQFFQTGFRRLIQETTSVLNEYRRFIRYRNQFQQTSVSRD